VFDPAPNLAVYTHPRATPIQMDDADIHTCLPQTFHLLLNECTLRRILDRRVHICNDQEFHYRVPLE
jgi:hypothetical protein